MVPARSKSARGFASNEVVENNERHRADMARCLSSRPGSPDWDLNLVLILPIHTSEMTLHGRPLRRLSLVRSAPKPHQHAVNDSIERLD